VLHSASVSQHRHDGVHRPPVAFHSAAVDFQIRLEDAPDIVLEVNSHHPLLFDMGEGRYGREHTFEDAPDNLRGFILAHLMPGTGAAGAGKTLGVSLNRVDLGSGLLEFRECALLVGSRVTCIGEVTRECNGVLRLCPWSPPPGGAGVAKSPKTTQSLAALRNRAVPWLAAPASVWANSLWPPGDREAVPWVQKLMISDDVQLANEGLVGLQKVSQIWRSCS